jgi:type II secretory pathway component PulJ
MRMSWVNGQVNHQSNGFILLEVLVAIGLVSGVWMSSVQTYQALALRLLKQEQKQSLLRQEFDRYELVEQIRANGSPTLKKTKTIKRILKARI